MKEITEEMFVATQKKYPPNAFTKLMFRYFSTNVAKDDREPKNILKIFLISCFALGFIGTVLSVTNIFLLFVTLTFTVTLVVFAIAMFLAMIMNNYRISKIRKELGISRSTYNDLTYYYA